MKSPDLTTSFSRFMATNHVCDVVDQTVSLRNLLAHPRYKSQVANIVRLLLKNKEPELRYAALEIISANLGELEIASTLLLEAVEILEDEKCQYVSDYLGSL